MTDNREYECIVLGATGYTGKYTCRHITKSLPTNFKWAVAGRSEAKLQAVVDGLQTVDRVKPDVLVASLDKSDLVALAKKTKVLITTIGPYHLYGTPVVEACAETGTHYLDVTGEIPWTLSMVQRYEATAKRNGAIMIPQNGVESAPPDLLCWLLATHIRESLSTGIGEAVVTMEMNSKPSGGTLATIMSLFDSYSARELQKAADPWSLCTVPKPAKVRSKGVLESITSVRTVEGLGTLTFGPQATSDLPIVHRSWSLFDDGKLYGKNFYANQYMTASGTMAAFMTSFVLQTLLATLAIPPVRWLLKKFIYQPGQGPTEEEVANEYCEWRAVANADNTDPNDPKRAFGRMRWDGSMYEMTGVCLAESALLLSREKTFAQELGGGFLTPATLGAKYVEALQRAGMKVDVRTMP